MTGHTVGRDHSMGIDERIVLHNPERHVVFWFNGVVANVLERVSHNLNTNTHPLTARRYFDTALAECSADTVICIKDLVILNSDIPEDIPRHEQSTVQRPPEMMVHDRPRHVRPDAHRTIPIIVDVARALTRAVRRRALLPHVACNLKGVRRLRRSLLPDRDERPC